MMQSSLTALPYLHLGSPTSSSSSSSSSSATTSSSSSSATTSSSSSSSSISAGGDGGGDTPAVGSSGWCCASHINFACTPATEAACIGQGYNWYAALDDCMFSCPWGPSSSSSASPSGSGLTCNCTALTTSGFGGNWDIAWLMYGPTSTSCYMNAGRCMFMPDFATATPTCTSGHAPYWDPCYIQYGEACSTYLYTNQTDCLAAGENWGHRWAITTMDGFPSGVYITAALGSETCPGDATWTTGAVTNESCSAQPTIGGCCYWLTGLATQGCSNTTLALCAGSWFAEVCGSSTVCISGVVGSSMLGPTTTCGSCSLSPKALSSSSSSSTIPKPSPFPEGLCPIFHIDDEEIRGPWENRDPDHNRNLTITQGNTVCYRIAVFDHGNPVDLRGKELKSYVKLHFSDYSYVEKFNALLIPGTINVIELSMSARQTTCLPITELVYSCEVTNGTDLEKVIQGYLRVLPEVTRDASFCAVFGFSPTVEPTSSSSSSASAFCCAKYWVKKIQYGNAWNFTIEVPTEEAVYEGVSYWEAELTTNPGQDNSFNEVELIQNEIDPNNVAFGYDMVYPVGNGRYRFIDKQKFVTNGVLDSVFSVPIPTVTYNNVYIRIRYFSNGGCATEWCGVSMTNETEVYTNCCPSSLLSSSSSSVPGGCCEEFGECENGVGTGCAHYGGVWNPLDSYDLGARVCYQNRIYVCDNSVEMGGPGCWAGCAPTAVDFMAGTDNCGWFLDTICSGGGGVSLSSVSSSISAQPSSSSSSRASSLSGTAIAACCLPNGNCVHVTADIQGQYACGLLGGIYVAGQTCWGGLCASYGRSSSSSSSSSALALTPRLPMVACCLPPIDIYYDYENNEWTGKPSCHPVTNDFDGWMNCIGEYAGVFHPSLACSDSPCSSPGGVPPLPTVAACCLPDGQCLTVEYGLQGEYVCTIIGGTYDGSRTCLSSPCPSLAGITTATCCLSGTCIEIEDTLDNYFTCVMQGGEYAPNTNCTTHPCIQSSSSSAAPAPSGGSFYFSVSHIGTFAYSIAGADRLGIVGGWNPSLEINVGDTMTLELVDAIGHPFWIKTVQGTGGANGAAGVSNNGAETGLVTWTPTVAGVYYYNCHHHPDMTNEIRVN